MTGFNKRTADLIAKTLKIASGETAPEKVENAFEALQGFRQSYCANDSVSVAAEHYLFTRYITSSDLLSGTAFFAAMPVLVPGYDFAKWLAKQAGTDIKTSDCESSEAHCWIRAWSYLGAYDGYGDRGDKTPKAPSHDKIVSGMCWPHKAPSK